MRLKSRLAHAFAAPRSQRDHSPLIDDLARRVVARRLTTPVCIFLESSLPLSRIAGHGVCVASPLLSLFITDKTLDDFADLLHDPDNVRKLVDRIHAYEHARGRSDD